MQLTPFIKSIMDDFLSKRIINLSYNSILNILLYELSKIPGAYRIKNYGKIVNYYCIGFAPSGQGKDYTINSCEELLLKDFRKHFNNKIFEAREKLKKGMEQEALEKYPYDLKGNNDKNLAKRNEWISNQKEKIREVASEISIKSSASGLYTDAATFSLYDFGSLNVECTELSSFMKSSKPEELRVFQHLLELYEGKIKPSSYKGESNKIYVENCHTNMMLLSDPSMLLNKIMKNNFLESLQTGFARRCNFTYQPISILKPVDFKVDFETEEFCLSNLTPRINEITNILENSDRNITFTPEAQKLLNDYNCKCVKKHNNILRYTHHVILNELKDRHYKAKARLYYSLYRTS